MTEDTECFYCGAKSENQCKDCGLFWYCSQLHFEYHKVPKTGECLPYHVKRNQEYGRYMVATRDIKPFQTVIADEALASGPSDDSKPSCLACLDQADFSAYCPQCNLPMCNKQECLESPLHKPECQVFAQHKPDKLVVHEGKVHPAFGLVVALRLLHLRKEDPPKWNRAIALASHLDERRHSDPKWLWVQLTALPILRNCGVSEEDISLVEILMAITRTNAVCLPRLQRTYKEPLGHGLFPMFSLLAHSCVGNCRFAVGKDGDSITITVRAMRHIPKGEHLTVQYKGPLTGNLERRKVFIEHWYFNCHCKRCADPTELGSYLSAMRCPDSDGFLLPIHALDPLSEWSCNKCAKTVSLEAVQQTVDELKSLVNKMSYAKPISEWEDLLTFLQTKLHPDHYLAMNVKLLLIQLYGTREKLECVQKVQRKLDLCENYLQVYTKVDPGYTRWRGRVLEEMSSCYLQLQKHNYEHGKIDEKAYLAAYKSSLLMLKVASKCRQYEPDDDHSFFAVYLRENNDALENDAV